MAAPPDVKLDSLGGQWVMNKTLSDDVDPVLALQGINWMTRKAISWATVTLSITQSAATSAAPTRITIANTATGGIKGTTEQRQLDHVERAHADPLFGPVAGRSRWFAPADVAAGEMDAWLLEGWAETAEGVGPAGESKIESEVRSETAGWEVRQVWGFAVVEGARYHVRRLVARKGETVLRIRIVYDFQAK